MGQHFALRALIFMLRMIAALILIFGVGGSLLLVVIGLLSPAVLPPNPTFDDVTGNVIAGVPDLRTQYAEIEEMRGQLTENLRGQTGIPELDMAMNSVLQMSDMTSRELGRSLNTVETIRQQPVPVRETATVLGGVLSVFSLIQAAISLLTGLIFWVIAGFLNDNLQQKVQADEARQSAYFMRQYSRQRFPATVDPTLTSRDYDRARDGMWADSQPSSRHWTPPQPVPRPPEPTPLDSYLKRNKKRPAPAAENRPTPSKGLLPFEQTPLGQYAARQRQKRR